MVEYPRSYSLLDENGPSPILSFIYSWNTFSLDSEQRSNHWRPTKDGRVGEVEYVMKSIIILLCFVIRQSITDIDAITLLKDECLCTSFLLSNEHFNSSWNLLINAETSVKQIGVSSLNWPSACYFPDVPFNCFFQTDIRVICCLEYGPKYLHQACGKHVAIRLKTAS